MAYKSHWSPLVAKSTLTDRPIHVRKLTPLFRARLAGMFCPLPGDHLVKYISAYFVFLVIFTVNTIHCKALCLVRNYVQVEC